MAAQPPILLRHRGVARSTQAKCLVGSHCSAMSATRTSVVDRRRASAFTHVSRAPPRRPPRTPRERRRKAEPKASPRHQRLDIERPRKVSKGLASTSKGDLMSVGSSVFPRRTAWTPRTRRAPPPGGPWPRSPPRARRARRAPVERAARLARAVGRQRRVVRPERLPRLPRVHQRVARRLGGRRGPPRALRPCPRRGRPCSQRQGRRSPRGERAPPANIREGAATASRTTHRACAGKHRRHGAGRKFVQGARGGLGLKGIHIISAVVTRGSS